MLGLGAGPLALPHIRPCFDAFRIINYYSYIVIYFMGYIINITVIEFIMKILCQAH